ncbi:MAG: TIGR00282 family metallophosphoesterase [Armatimonadia bacterium]|nr:TIGR00282 family metallophosphoesterase [Armatimonadia bacterium]
MRILCIGDIVGKPGRQAFLELVPGLRERLDLDFVIVNGENAAGGFGLTPPIADQLLQGGADAITSGNHVLSKKELEPYLATSERLLRPANWPPGTPGRGATVLPARTGQPVGVVNLQGLVFMEALDCPFRRGKAILDELRERTPILLVDFHAEATAEKVAFAHFVDGIASAVVGTHTHVQTADERILPGGTAFICDMGMTGPYHSVIGMNPDIIVEKFVYKLPRRFEVAGDDAVLCGALVDVDEETGRASSIERIREPAGGKGDR